MSPAEPRSSGSDFGPATLSGPLSDPISDREANTATPLASSKPLKVGRDVLRDTFHDLVLIASNFVHEAATRPDTPERDADLWLANDTEQAGIGDPIADITERRFGLAQINNPDVADLIEAGIALARYGARHLKTAWNIRRAKRRMATALPDLTEHPALEGQPS